MVKFSLFYQICGDHLGPEILSKRCHFNKRYEVVLNFLVKFRDIFHFKNFFEIEIKLRLEKLQWKIFETKIPTIKLIYNSTLVNFDKDQFSRTLMYTTWGERVKTLTPVKFFLLLKITVSRKDLRSIYLTFNHFKKAF